MSVLITSECAVKVLITSYDVFSVLCVASCIKHIRGSYGLIKQKQAGLFIIYELNSICTYMLYTHILPCTVHVVRKHELLQ